MTERKLLIGGEWVETGEWLEVRSPFSGEVVGRVAKGGADEARAAIDAAEQAMADPLPAHKRAEILVKVVAGIARRHDEIAAQISGEAGKPMKAAKVETSRARTVAALAVAPASRARRVRWCIDPSWWVPHGLCRVTIKIAAHGTRQRE